MAQMTMAYMRRKRWEARVFAVTILELISDNMPKRKTASAMDLRALGIRLPEGFH